MDPTVVTIPMVGGPGHGHVVICVVGPDGRPPLTHWLLGAGGLSRAPMYELESVEVEAAEAGERESEAAPWRYCFRVYLADAGMPMPSARTGLPDSP
jgi:hypothetical protein